MWIAKGTLLGFWLFGFGTMAWLYFALYRNLRPNSAVSISVFSGLTTANPYWWAALALCLVLGLAIANPRTRQSARAAHQYGFAVVRPEKTLIDTAELGRKLRYRAK